MKNYLLPLCALFLLLLSACRPGGAEDSAPPESEGPIHLESLSVEVPRAGRSAEELSQAVRELPEDLKAALAAQSVEVEAVTVSVGSSPAATAQAVHEGGVNLAFLTQEDLDALEEPPQTLLASAPESGESPDSMAAIVRPEEDTLSGEAFAQALAAAVNSLREEQPVFGPYDYTYVEPDGETGQ